MNNSKGVCMEKISLVIQQIVEVLIDFGPVGGFFLVIMESILPVLPLGVIVGLNIYPIFITPKIFRRIYRAINTFFPNCMIT